MAHSDPMKQLVIVKTEVIRCREHILESMLGSQNLKNEMK